MFYLYVNKPPQGSTDCPIISNLYYAINNIVAFQFEFCQGNKHLTLMQFNYNFCY
jgi:hypothetical protein